MPTMFRVFLRIPNMFRRVEPQPPSTSKCKEKERGYVGRFDNQRIYTQSLSPRLSDDSFFRTRETLSIRKDVLGRLDPSVDGVLRDVA